MTVVGCVPLDERPVSTVLPSLVCAVAGARLELPPAAALPARRRAGDPDALVAWLGDQVCDAAVVSLEGLTSGGLVASRTGSEPLAVLLGRLDVLRRLPVPVLAAVLVPRAPDTDDAAEEPGYWAEHGRALHALSGALHRGDDVTGPGAGVPGDVRLDWTRRRLRQHQLALAALDLVAAGDVSTLTVGVDDTAVHSLSVPDAEHLRDQARRLDVQDRVGVGHGADETTAVLCARALLGLSGLPGPRVALACAAEDGLARTARYESGPVRATALGQLRAAGATVVADATAAEVVLVVHAPDGAGDWAVAPPAATDGAAARATASLVAEHLAAGRPVAVADVAQPNGADPALVAALAEDGTLLRLSAWAAWNTAGNTLGTVAAHLVAGHVGRESGSHDDAAHRRLLAARLVEDWAWMTVVRAEVRARTGGDPQLHDHVPPDHPALVPVAGRLQELLATLAPGLGWQVRPHGVRLPWHRTFEVAVELVPAGARAGVPA